MTTPLCKDTKAVLKLDLGENGVRRITLAKLWDESRSTISYDRLVELAVGFSNVPLRAVQSGRVTVTITYMDEDNDEITISSDEELADAFDQFVNSEPPVVRAKAVVDSKMKPKSNNNHNNSGSAKPLVKDWCQKKKADRAQARDRGEKGRHHGKGNNPNHQAFCTSLKDRLNQVDATIPFPPVVHRPPAVAPPKTSVDDTAGCDPNFIHGRHTCDGCLATPIFGIRYHAINMPDYDLCSQCHDSYQGTEMTFKPMELDRDRHLQSRWQRRRMRRCRPMTRTQGLGSALEKRGTQTRKVIDDMDGALKEAIRRSLIEAWPKGKKEKVDQSSVKTKTTEGVENVPAKPIEEPKDSTEPDIPVPAVEVVDISAGNEHTQRALDEMNPKVKEALSRRINELFASRANRKVDDKDHDLKLSPDEETQRKIDSMDLAMKEAIRRSLNQFFANRRAMKQSEKESQDDIQRTQAIIDAMDDKTREKISLSFNEFFAHCSKKVGDKPDLVSESHSSIDEEPKEDESKEEIPNVVVDIIVDDDDDDLSEGTEEEANNDTDEESKISIDGISVKNDEWQMVTEDDEMIAVAAQMLGSALFQSDASISNHSSV